MINILLYALRAKVAEKNTYIGYAHKGFDFLGKHIQPTRVLPSATALSRMHMKTARLYEQGASSRRIVRYWVRWLGWACSCLLIPITPHTQACSNLDSTINQHLTMCVCDDSDITIDITTNVWDSATNVDLCKDHTCNTTQSISNDTITTSTRFYFKHYNFEHIYSCHYTLNSGFTAPLHHPAPATPVPASTLNTIPSLIMLIATLILLSCRRFLHQHLET